MPTVTRNTQWPGDRCPEEGGCAFVVAEPGRAAREAVFCNALRRPGSSYCPAHHTLCHLPPDSFAEQQQLREIEALADAIGGKTGRDARRPPPRVLRRLDRIARGFLGPRRSRIVPIGEVDNDARR